MSHRKNPVYWALQTLIYCSFLWKGPTWACRLDLSVSSHITVADDLALLAQNRADMQIMVRDAENGADRERYCIHPAKRILPCSVIMEIERVSRN